LSAISLYPRIVQKDEVASLERVVTMEEILEVLKGFAKDKSPDLGGWIVEFFLFFFDLVGPELPTIIEETRVCGKVIRPLNSTFLALIPKAYRPSSLSDFRPIALCNLCYNIVTKIIACRIRPFLSKARFEEQLSFLKGRHILDAIGTAQECLQSIKTKKIQAVLLKLDLKKAYDCTIWDYLRLLLLQCGFGYLMFN
jgi:hypothetical protein